MNEGRIKRILKKVVICIAIVVATFGVLVAYTDNTVENISDNIVRLHVVADSDLDVDQNIKLKVRDKVLEYMADKLKDAKTEEESAKIVKDNLYGIEKVAQEVIEDEGEDYEVAAEYGKFVFPTKNYANIRLPAGQYNSLRITLGKGKGQNWWCVMFPPLCFVDSAEGELSTESQEKLKEVVPEDEYKMITDNEEDGDIKFNIKFKIVEVIQELKNSIMDLF